MLTFTSETNIIPHMKKVVFAATLVLALLTAKPVVAQETCVQVQVYGGGVGTVCGAKTHETVDTAFEGLTPGMLGGALVGVSGILGLLARKVRSQKLA
jgi:hypothetical protein